MNPNVKGLSIGGVTGFASYVADLVLFGMEQGLHMDFPDRIDTAITGVVIGIAGYLMYRLLPASQAVTAAG
jgi:hypothetical protein